MNNLLRLCGDCPPMAVCCYLLGNGADVNLKNKLGQTAFEMAAAANMRHLTVVFKTFMLAYKWHYFFYRGWGLVCGYCRFNFVAPTKKNLRKLVLAYWRNRKTISKAIYVNCATNRKLTFVSSRAIIFYIARIAFELRRAKYANALDATPT